MSCPNSLAELEAKCGYFNLFSLKKVLEIFSEKLSINSVYVGWGDYYFSYAFDTENRTEPAKLRLVSRTSGDILLENIGDFQYCVVGDTVYSIELGSTTISSINLQTQKKNRYNFRMGIIKANSYLKEEIAKAFGDGMEELLSFTTTENGKILWATDGEYLYRMDSERLYPFEIETPDANRRIETLYTDGRSAYGLYSSERDGKLQLVRFCTEVLTEERGDVPAVAQVEYLVPEGSTR